MKKLNKFFILLISLSIFASSLFSCSSCDPVVKPEEKKAIEKAADFKETVVKVYIFDSYYKNPKAFGSGFIISDDGYILTNYHVVSMVAEQKENYAILVEIFKKSDDNKYKSEIYYTDLIDYDSYIDIALIKVHSLHKDVKQTVFDKDVNKGRDKFDYITLGNSDEIKESTSIDCHGYPSRGEINSLNDILYSFNSGKISRIINDGEYFEHDGKLDRGNSGGPAIKDNKVIGINVAVTQSEIGNLFSLTIPINYALGIFPDALLEKIKKKILV